MDHSNQTTQNTKEPKKYKEYPKFDFNQLRKLQNHVEDRKVLLATIKTLQEEKLYYGKLYKDELEEKAALRELNETFNAIEELSETKRMIGQHEETKAELLNCKKQHEKTLEENAKLQAIESNYQRLQETHQRLQGEYASLTQSFSQLNLSYTENLKSFEQNVNDAAMAFEADYLIKEQQYLDLIEELKQENSKKQQTWKEQLDKTNNDLRDALMTNAQLHSKILDQRIASSYRTQRVGSQVGQMLINNTQNNISQAEVDETSETLQENSLKPPRNWENELTNEEDFIIEATFRDKSPEVEIARRISQNSVMPSVFEIEDKNASEKIDQVIEAEKQVAEYSVKAGQSNKNLNEFTGQIDDLEENDEDSRFVRFPRRNQRQTLYKRTKTSTQSRNDNLWSKSTTNKTAESETIGNVSLCSLPLNPQTKTGVNNNAPKQLKSKGKKRKLNSEGQLNDIITDIFSQQDKK